MFLGVITGADVHGNEAWLTAQLWVLHRDPGLQRRLTQPNLRCGADRITDARRAILSAYAGLPCQEQIEYSVPKTCLERVTAGDER